MSTSTRSRKNVRQVLPSVGQLADEFAKTLAGKMSKASWRKMRKQNAVCASYRFCDADQAMLEALARLGVKKRLPFDKVSDPDGSLGTLCDEAWDLAKQLYLTSIHRERPEDAESRDRRRTSHISARRGARSRVRSVSSTGMQGER